MGTESRDSEAPVTRRGRPPGEVTPETLIRQELMAHLRLYKKTRELIEKRLDDPQLDPEDLAKYMELLRKGIVEMAKPVVPVAKAADAKPIEADEDPAAVLQRLIGA